MTGIIVIKRILNAAVEADGRGDHDHNSGCKDSYRCKSHGILFHSVKKTGNSGHVVFSVIILFVFLKAFKHKCGACNKETVGSDDNKKYCRKKQRECLERSRCCNSYKISCPECSDPYDKKYPSYLRLSLTDMLSRKHLNWSHKHYRQTADKKSQKIKCHEDQYRDQYRSDVHIIKTCYDPRMHQPADKYGRRLVKDHSKDQSECCGRQCGDHGFGKQHLYDMSLLHSENVVESVLTLTAFHKECIYIEDQYK